MGDKGVLGQPAAGTAGWGGGKRRWGREGDFWESSVAKTRVMLHPLGDFDQAREKPRHRREGCCRCAIPGEQRLAAKLSREGGEAALGWVDRQHPRGAWPPSCKGHPKRGAPAAPGPSAQPGSCRPPAQVPVPSQRQLFLAVTKLLHAHIITPSQSSSGGRRRCGAAISLLPGIFSCGPGWEKAWPQHRGHSLEEEPGPTAPPGLIRPNNGPERLEKCSHFPGLAPGLGLGCAASWGPDWGGGNPIPSQALGMLG